MRVQLCGKGRGLTDWQGDKQAELFFYLSLSLSLDLYLIIAFIVQWKDVLDLICYAFLTNWTVFMYQKKDVE